MRRTLAAALLALAGPVVPAARAQEPLPIDVELIRPGLSPLGGFAVDAPQAIAARTWSAGALLQYENAPLRLYDGDDRLGDLVEHRTVVQLHGGVSASKRTSFSFVLPVAGHFGADTDVPRARNGAGLGDASITARVQAGTWGPFSLGVLGTVLLPTGNHAQYMGERLPRLRAGLLGYTDLGRVRVLTNLLALVRQPVPTVYDFTAGSELQIDVGVQGAVVPHRLLLIGELVSRIGLSTDPGGGRLASELLAGVRYTPGATAGYGADRGLRVDLALGKGLTSGYGTTEVRALLGVSYVGVPRPRVAPPPPPEPVPEVVAEQALPEAAPPPPPPPPPPAQLQGARIVFRDPIEFEQGTTRLTPSSEPVLDAVAAVILGHAAGLHVVVEGHASDEGGFAYNYELSRERARAIAEALVLRGVHPKRLSWRGAGEVEPIAPGDDEAARERNRRVVFRVMRPMDEDEGQVYDTEVRLPWSGEPHRVVEPPPTPAPAPPPPQPAPAEPADVPERTFETPPDDEISLPSDPEPTP